MRLLIACLLIPLFQAAVLLAAEPIEPIGPRHAKVPDRSLRKKAPSKPPNSVAEFRGKLTTGVFAIGGETTGTTLATDHGTWELDFGDNSQLHKSAQRLNGKMVAVEGFATQREGVEIKTRRIIRVKGIAAIDDDAAGEGAVPVIRAITGFKLPIARGPGFGRAKPKTFETIEELGNILGDKAAEKISEQVDFGDQFLLFFQWAGSGQDKLSFRIDEDGETPKVVFNFRPGRTRDLRPHAYLYAIRDGVTWEVGQRNIPPRIPVPKENL